MAVPHRLLIQLRCRTVLYLASDISCCKPLAVIPCDTIQLYTHRGEGYVDCRIGCTGGICFGVSDTDYVDQMIGDCDNQVGVLA